MAMQRWELLQIIYPVVWGMLVHRWLGSSATATFQPCQDCKVTTIASPALSLPDSHNKATQRSLPQALGVGDFHQHLTSSLNKAMITAKRHSTVRFLIQLPEASKHLRVNAFTCHLLNSNSPKIRR